VSLLLAALLAWAAPTPLPAATLEYQVKAAFLLSFLTFTEWPAGTFESPQAPLRICVLGADPFDGSLARTVQGESVDGHPLVTDRIARGQDVRGCHVVFVPAAVDDRALSVELGALDTAALVVGDSPGLATTASITFAIERGRVRFDVNRTLAERSGLRFSSKLLKNARVVR